MASFSICGCLPKISGPGVKVVPVMFPPGRLRLATSPISTGSLGKIMTMGMLLVAFFAASAADPAGATITSTLRRTNSAARSGSRSTFPSAHRYSMMRFWPSTQPSSQLSQEGVEPVLHGLAGGRAQITDAVHLARLLCLGGERYSAEGERSKE